MTLSVWTWTGARGEHAIAFLSARGEVLLLITSLRLKEPGKVAQPHTVINVRREQGSGQIILPAHL